MPYSKGISEILMEVEVILIIKLAGYKNLLYLCSQIL